MKFVCERDVLDRCIKLVASRAKGKTKVQILACFLLSADGSEFSLTATDLETQSRVGGRCELAEPGAVAISADRLAKLVDATPKGSQIQFATDGPEVLIAAGRASYRLPTLVATDFPVMEDALGDEAFTLSAANVRALMSECLPVIRADSSRPYLEGGHLSQAKDGEIILSATNGLQLIRLAQPAPGVKLSQNVTIPKSSMVEIARLASDGDVTISVSAGRMVVHAGGCRFATKLIEVTYPNLDRVIRDLGDRYITVDRATLWSALRRLDSLSDEKSTFNFRWDGDAKSLDLTLAGEGLGSETIECSSSLPSGYISFTPGILKPVLEAFTGELLQLHIGAPTEALRILDPSIPELTVQAMPCLPRG